MEESPAEKSMFLYIVSARNTPDNMLCQRAAMTICFPVSKKGTAGR